MTAFCNKYVAATIIALVFLSSNLHSQRVDTVHTRPVIGTNLGMKYLFLESSYGIKAGIDTSTKLAQKDTNTMVIFRGTGFVWSQKSGVLRWDTLKTTTGAAFDSTDVKFTTYLSNNYLNGYDPTYFNGIGGILGLNVGALPSGGGPVYWYATLDSLKAHKPSDGSVGYTNEYALHNGGGMRYVFFAGSTATGNDMTIITPTAGGTGRWYAQPLNGRFTFRQCGVFPSSDNTTAMNAAELAVRVAGYHFIGVDENSNYKIDPAIGFIPVDSMTLFGMDTITSQITPKTYSTHGKFLIIYNSGSDTLVDFHVKNLRLDYLQKGNFTGGFASGNPIGDTDSHIINITLGRDIYIEGCAIVNGGTQSAVNLVHVINGFVRYNRFDSIACKVLSTVGVADNRNIHFEFNKVRRSGWYERWSVEVDLPQEGDDVAYLGGTLNYLNDNEISEMYGRWFWTEGTIFGYNECKRNKIHGSNKNHLGVSWGNDPLTTTWAKGVQITDNVYDGITFDHFTSADSATVHSVFQPKRFATCLFEFGGMENLYQHDYLSHPHFTVARHMRDSWFDNIINSPNSNTTTDPSGGQIIYQVGTGSGDSVLNTKITGTINFKDGQIFKTYGGGCVVKDLNISVNAKWTGTAFIGEIYPATGGVVPTGININGSTFAGNVSSAFYTGTASPVVMNFTNNVASNIDPASNFLTVASGVAPVINKENTRFSTGVFTTHAVTTPQLGVIYNKNSWTSLSDFTQAGGVSASIVSNKIQVTGGVGTYTQLLELTPALGFTKLEHYKVAMKVKQGAITASSYGYGIGINSHNSFINAGVVARIGFTTGFPNSGVELDANAGGSYGFVSYTRRQITAVANDYVLVTMEKNGYDIHYTARNMTTNSVEIDSTFAVGENTGPFSIFSMGGTFTIDSLAITSTELTGGTVFIGDSKTEGTGATTIDSRYVSLLQNQYDGIVGVGGGGDRTAEILGRMPQILSLKGRRYVLELGSNDLRSGVSNGTFQTNFTSIYNQLIAAGVDVYILLPFYETSEDLSTQRAWFIATFPANKIIDTWTPMAVPGRLAVDGIHPNDAGHAAIAAAIIQANVITEAKTQQRLTVELIGGGGGGGPTTATWDSTMANGATTSRTPIVDNNQNTATGFEVKNQNTGAAAEAYLALRSNSGSAGWELFGPGVTNETVFTASSGLSGMAFATLGNIPIKFRTNSTGVTNDRLTITGSGNVGIGTTSPNASALLDLSSTTQGFLPPRLTSIQINAISSPAAGLIVWNSDSLALFKYTGVGWLKAEGSGGGGGGSQTFQQVLTTGATMTGNNTVALGGNNFAFSATSTDPITVNGNVNGESRFLETNANSAGGVSHYFQNDRLSYSANYAGFHLGGSTEAGTFLGVPLADGFFLFNNGSNSGSMGIGTTAAKSLALATNNTARHTIDGSGNQTFTLGSDATGDMWYRNSSGYFTRLAIGTAGQHLVGGTTPHWVDTASASSGTGPSTAYSNTATGKTANHTMTFTTDNDGVSHLYRVNPYTIITTGSGAGDSKVKFTLSFTDGGGNTVTTQAMSLPFQTTADGLAATAVGSSNYQPVVISISPNTTITFSWNVSGTNGMTWSEAIVLEKIL
jgi:lysophospholipase L1-like esterase